MIDRIPRKALGYNLFPFIRSLLRRLIFPPFGSLRTNLPLTTREVRSLSAKRIVSEPPVLAGQRFSLPLL